MDPTAKVDVDNDGIGLKSTYTFDCTNTASGANTYTMKGSLLEVDKDDTAGSNHAGGWRFDLDYNWTYTAMRAGNGSYTLKGFFDLTKGATNYVYASNYQMAFSGSASPDDRATYAITMGSTWNHTITPDDMALPKKSGAITFSGFWGYKVNVTTRAEANVELVLQGTSAGLTYDQSCSNHFKAGTITFTAGTGTMTMTYDCNNATVVKLNGTVI